MNSFGIRQKSIEVHSDLVAYPYPRSPNVRKNQTLGRGLLGAIKALEQFYDFTWFAGTSAGAITASLLAVGYSSSELENVIGSKDFSEFKDAKFWQLIPNLIYNQGLYRGVTIVNWLEELYSEKGNRYGVSGLPILMGDLKKFPNNPRLTIYACSKSAPEGILKLDSSDTEIRMFHIAEAVRASMAIPLFFTPARHFNLGVWDGGMKNNYPVSKLLEDNPGTEFIGLYLGSEIYKGDPHAGKIRGALKDIFSIWSEVNDTDALRKYNSNTIIIDTFPIKTTDFSLTNLEKTFLLAVGRASALKFIEKQNFPIGPTSELVEEAKDVAEKLRKEVINKRRKRFRIKLGVWFLSLALVISLILYIIKGREISLQRISEEPVIIKKDSNGYKDFFARVVDGHGHPIQGVKVAFQTPACGPNIYVAETKEDGTVSATNMCLLSPGIYKQVVTIVEKDAIPGFTQIGRVRPTGKSIIIEFHRE